MCERCFSLDELNENYPDDDDYVCNVCIKIMIKENNENE